jgi:hypothetical protein
MWQEVGMFEGGAMGPTRLSSCEIDAWKRCTNRSLAEWEFTSIREMSGSYLAALRAGETHGAPPPYGNVDFDRAKLSSQLMASLRQHRTVIKE